MKPSLPTSEILQKSDSQKLREAAAELKRRYALYDADFRAYATAATRGFWQPALHLDKLCEILQAVEAGDIKRVLIQVPPRHGKSETTSGIFPTYFLGRNPDKKVMLASYEHDFATTWGVMSRDRFDFIAPQLWKLKVDKNKKAGDDWKIKDHRGGMTCAGVGGTLTGKGADLLIIDDPIKNAEEANSQTYRDKMWDWYRSTAYTRLEPGGAVIIIQTRWHEEDLIGHVLEEEKDQWLLYSFPAIAEENDVLGRNPGDALWPARYDIEALERIKKSVGPYFWEALYQQRPTPPQGNLFQYSWWKYYRTNELPKDPQGNYTFDKMVQSWDMTFKNTDGTDFVVGQVWASKGARIFLLDQVRRRMDAMQTAQQMIEMSRKWPQATLKLVEEAANGPAVISILQTKVPGLYPVPPKGNKLSRAHAAVPLVAAGNVWIPDPTEQPWAEEYKKELGSFPFASHDDQVDATSLGLTMFIHVKDPIAEEAMPDPRSRRIKDLQFYAKWAETQLREPVTEEYY